MSYPPYDPSRPDGAAYPGATPQLPPNGGGYPGQQPGYPTAHPTAGQPQGPSPYPGQPYPAQQPYQGQQPGFGGPPMNGMGPDGGQWGQPPKKKRTGLIVTLVCLLVVAIAVPVGWFTFGKDFFGSTPVPEADASTPATAGYEPPPLTWSACEGQETDGLECATLTVPLDWDDVEGATIDLAVARRITAPEADRLGNIVINPGGPGGSGIDLLKFFRASPELESKYDFVSFDPRGIGGSEGLDCINLLDVFLPSDQSMHDLCAERSGSEVLDYMDTESVVKDMDTLRLALDEKQLNYLGFSYGTQIGAYYAEMFPDRVGRFVLDGALDPSLDLHDLLIQTAESWDETFTAWIPDGCIGQSDCPFDGSVDDAVADFTTFMDDIEASPLPVEFVLSLGPNEIQQAWEIAMSRPDTWPDFRAALSAAMDGDGQPMYDFLHADLLTSLLSVFLADYSNSVAHWAVRCEDYMAADITVTSEELVEAGPMFGRTLPAVDTQCDGFTPRGEPHVTEYTGDNEILVVNKTHDPRTRHSWAEALTEELGNASLLTFDGWGHCTYGLSDSCIDDAVDSYFIDGTVPKDGTVCSG